MTRPAKFSGREDYFAVNDKPMGLSTSFRVSGRLGELARRFCTYQEARADNARINQAYRLGYKHGFEVATDKRETAA